MIITTYVRGNTFVSADLPIVKGNDCSWITLVVNEFSKEDGSIEIPLDSGRVLVIPGTAQKNVFFVVEE